MRHVSWWVEGGECVQPVGQPQTVPRQAPERLQTTPTQAPPNPMAEPQQPASMDSLDAALLTKILGKLEPRDQGRAAGTSHAFRQAAAPLAPALRHHSAQGDAAAVLGLLLRGSAGLGARHPAVASTALHLAAGRGHAEVVSLLLLAGMRPDEAAEDGSLPLVRAAMLGGLGASLRWRGCWRPEYPSTSVVLEV